MLNMAEGDYEFIIYILFESFGVALGGMAEMH